MARNPELGRPDDHPESQDVSGATKRHWQMYSDERCEASREYLKEPQRSLDGTVPPEATVVTAVRDVVTAEVDEEDGTFFWITMP